MTERREEPGRIDPKVFAIELLETALRADDVPAAFAAVRADVEVLDREQLVAVAVSLAVAGARLVPAKADRPRLRERLERLRLEFMVMSS